MSFNIMDLVKDQLSDQVMGQLGTVLGGTATQNDSAISSAIPGLLTGLTKLGASDKGADSLFSAINDQDDSILDNLGDMLSGSNQSSMMEMGTKALGGLLGGGGLGSLISAVSGFSGASKSGTGSLMGLLAPILFGIVKRKLLGGGSSGFNVGSLMNMFNGQKDNVAAAMPAGFSDALKLTDFDKIGSNIEDRVEAAADNVVHNTREVASEGKSFISRILPIAILVGAALLAYNLLFKGSTTENTGTTSSSQMESMDADGIGKELTSTLGTLTSTFGSITDVDSAKAAIPNLTSATDQLGNLAGMMDKLPEAARGPVKQIVSSGLPQIQGIIEKLSAIPGVGEIIKPVVESLSAKLAMFN